MVEGVAAVPGAEVWVGGRLRRAGGAVGGAMGMSDPWGVSCVLFEELVTGCVGAGAFVGVRAEEIGGARGARGG